MTDRTPQPIVPGAPWDNLFGVCACLGEDFGFDPIWLRLALAVALIADPVAVIAAYFALGAVVLASRLALPNRRRPPADLAQVAPPQPVAEPEFRLAA